MTGYWHVVTVLAWIAGGYLVLYVAVGVTLWLVFYRRNAEALRMRDTDD